MEVLFRRDGGSMEEFKGRGQKRHRTLVVDVDGLGKSSGINIRVEGPILHPSDKGNLINLN